MALIDCPECKKQISTFAVSCPHCGCPIMKPAALEAETDAMQAASASASKPVKASGKTKELLFIRMKRIAAWFRMAFEKIGIKRLILALSGMVLIIAAILILSSVCFHDWTNATCTKPQTCNTCGEVRGEAIGHTWMEATCTTPKTCSVCNERIGGVQHAWMEASCEAPQTCKICGITSGAKLEHNVTEWKQLQKSTCITSGSEGGTCSLCGKTITRETEKTDHTPSAQWVVIKEADVGSDGEKATKCTVCQEIVERQAYSLSDSEIISILKSAAKVYAYNDVMRYPENYEGEYVKFSGKVVQVISGFFATYYRLSIGSSNVIYVYDCSVNDKRIIEDDRITVYGIMAGTKTYESILGASITIPAMDAYYIE